MSDSIRQRRRDWAGIYDARRLLPWIGLLMFVSAVAVAMTVGVSNIPMMREAQIRISPAESLVDTSAPVRAGWAESEDSDSTGCDLSGHRLVYAGLNTWLPAEPRTTPCPTGVP